MMYLHRFLTDFISSKNAIEGSNFNRHRLQLGARGPNIMHHASSLKSIPQVSMMDSSPSLVSGNKHRSLPDFHVKKFEIS